jgi:uncharacterized protein (DUF488 family)
MRQRLVTQAPDLPVFTIGHSTRTLAQFVALLRAASVQRVVDVRTVPRSRTNPDYNLDHLPEALADFQIDHRRIAALGGLRKRSLTVPAEANGLWTNRSFHNYADHALSAEFRAGLAELTEVSTERRTAIMCAEAVWWRCRIIADYLIAGGREVFHLMDEAKIAPAKPTPGMRIAGDQIFYPGAGGAQPNRI